MNLISNASMATFPENILSQFTTLLPQQLTLKGSCEVALYEIAGPASIQNKTTSQFKYQLAVVTALKETENNENGSSHEVRKNKRKRKPYGMIRCTSIQHYLLKKNLLKNYKHQARCLCKYRPN